MTGPDAAPDVDIDARGLRCPWPALRLARFMRAADRAVIVADDPVAPAEIAALADDRDWTVETLETPLGPGWMISR